MAHQLWKGKKPGKYRAVVYLSEEQAHQLEQRALQDNRSVSNYLYNLVMKDTQKPRE